MHTTTCPLCSEPVLPEQKYCTRCERLLSSATPGEPSKSKWYYNIWVLLFMLFFVLGPLGLPLVWKNPRLSRPMKMALTLVMVIYAVVLVDMMLRAFQAVMHEMGQLNTVL